jgi:hypothetical protein
MVLKTDAAFCALRVYITLRDRINFTHPLDHCAGNLLF